MEAMTAALAPAITPSAQAYKYVRYNIQYCKFKKREESYIPWEQRLAMASLWSREAKLVISATFLAIIVWFGWFVVNQREKDIGGVFGVDGVRYL